MRVERRGLENFSKGEPHLFGERSKMGRGNLAEGVLDEMQMFDQQVATPRQVA